jgi:hypothetical protein
MNEQLHKLLLDLDYKFDVEIDNYFELTESDKDELTYTIVEYFTPYAMSHIYAVGNIIRGLKIMIDEAEYYEDYEKAEIFNRCRLKFEEMTFS